MKSKEWGDSKVRLCDWCKTKHGRIRIGNFVFCSKIHANDWAESAKGSK